MCRWAISWLIVGGVFVVALVVLDVLVVVLKVATVEKALLLAEAVVMVVG